MECTQRFDEFSQTQTDGICLEQIGFLGILGTKYPVKRGPNKIGRDPQTCCIVLNLNSISRQHAVINVLNGRNFMLMDLDSANKTRLNSRVLQAYIPVPISNGDTVQFGEVFGIFRLLEEETELPCTQAVDVPDTPARHVAGHRHAVVPDTPARHVAAHRHAVVPESPDVSDKDDSFIMPSQPKPQHRIKSPGNNFTKPSSKAIAIQPAGSDRIDNVFWKSSNKSNSFNLDASTSSLNESNQNGDIRETEKQQDESTDSIYTAKMQLPLKCASIHSQDTQLPTPDLVAGKDEDNDIFNAETQLPSNKENSFVIEDDIFNASTQLPDVMSPKSNRHENIFEANTQLPGEQLNAVNNCNIYEAETQLPTKDFDISNKQVNSIHELESQVPFPGHNESTDSLYTAETQLPPVNASSSIYSQETQLPKLGACEDRNSPKSIQDVNTQLPFEEPNVSRKNDDIFYAETQLSTIKKEFECLLHKSNEDNRDLDIGLRIEKQIESNKIPNNIDVKNTSKDNSREKIDKSDELILFDEVETHNDLDVLNESQPILGGDIVPLQEDSEDIPLSQSDTITDDDFETKLEDNKTGLKLAKRDARAKSDISSDCEELDLLSTQKIPENQANEDEVTDCEEDEIYGKAPNTSALNGNSKSNLDLDEVATQVIPAAEPAFPFESLATQVIPVIIVDNAENSKPGNPSNEPNFEDMLTQVIPEDCDKDPDFEDLPTQVIVEDVSNNPNTNILQFSDEVVPSPFKIPLQTPIKIKKKDIPKINDIKNAKSNLVKPNTKNDNNDEKYYNATQEILEDLCSQENTSTTISSVEDHKVGTKLPNFKGEMEISVKKFARESSESSDGEEKVNKFINNLSVKQISEVIGVDVTLPKRIPSDASDPEVTPKKVRPFQFMETLLPDSQEIKTSVSLSTNTVATDSSSESEQEKESQEQTPIVFRKKKRAKSDVKKDLITKFDVEALPTRIITRTRKPTSKLQESDAAAKKRNRNILKPKFLNNTEQEEEVDTEIISENITRLKTKNDKKNHKNISVDGDKIEVKTETSKRKSNEETLSASKPGQYSRNKSKNNIKDNIVDLTSLDEEQRPETRRKNGMSKNNKDTTAEITKLDEITTKDKHKSNKTNNSKQKPNEPRKIGRPKKKDVQEKITNYTITTDEARISNSMSHIDENLNTSSDKKNGTKSTQRNKDSNSEKIVPVENETIVKRKRGRPRKEDKEKDKKELKDNSIETKRRMNDDKQEVNEQQEVRRSRRQKITKENESQSRSRNHDQSTVYSVSSESSVDSPKRKRIEAIDTEAPSPKRTRSMTSSAVISSDTSSVCTTLNSNSSSLRSTPAHAPKTHYVLFTAFPSEEVKQKLEQLGAVVVADVALCSVVLTLSLRRTFKLLCAVGLGRPIVGPAWVQACSDTDTIVDPWQHILVDTASEARFNFSLRRTLTGARNYLAGYSVSATPRVLPSAAEMKQIVECSGGAWREGGGGGGGGGRWLVVSCAADRALHASLRARGAVLVSSELVLSGVLRQELDVDAHLLH